MKRTYSLIAITLFASLCIYLFYRTEKTVVNELVLFFFSRDTFAQIRNIVAKALPLSNPIIFSLPGGLWVFCSTVLAKDIYLVIRDRHIPTVTVPLLFAVGLEICQLVHITKGTFDLWDIAFYAMFWLVAYVGFQFQPKHSILSTFARNGFIWLASFLSVFFAHVNT